MLSKYFHNNHLPFASIWKHLVNIRILHLIKNKESLFNFNNSFEPCCLGDSNWLYMLEQDSERKNGKRERERKLVFIAGKIKS